MRRETSFWHTHLRAHFFLLLFVYAIQLTLLGKTCRKCPVLSVLGQNRDRDDFSFAARKSSSELVNLWKFVVSARNRIPNAHSEA